MGSSTQILQMRSSSARLYVVRSVEKYQAMGATDLHREYERQVAAARGAAPLTVVK
jgi:hypothetical protein